MGIYDVESFFWALDQLNGNFNDIGAHKDFQKPVLLMPELLIKELCIGVSVINVYSVMQSYGNSPCRDGV